MNLTTDLLNVSDKMMDLSIRELVVEHKILQQNYLSFNENFCCFAGDSVE